jgi:hypothetical protein
MAVAVTCDPLYFMRFAFADALKKDIKAAMDLALRAAYRPSSYVNEIEDWFHDPVMKEKIRPMLVGWGAGMRAVDSDHWIKRLARNMHPMTLLRCDPSNEDTRRVTSRCVITDVRYLNEADWVRSLGGLVVWIERPGVFAANDEELFKTLPDYCDVRLLLDGSIEENQAKFCKIAEDWLDQCRQCPQGDHDAETH